VTSKIRGVEFVKLLLQVGDVFLLTDVSQGLRASLSEPITTLVALENTSTVSVFLFLTIEELSVYVLEFV
jgi:hypothetical protein